MSSHQPDHHAHHPFDDGRTVNAERSDNHAFQLSRRRGLQLEALGSVLISTVMLADRFLFTLRDGFVLSAAIVSALFLTAGIRVVKRADEQAQNGDQAPE